MSIYMHVLYMHVSYMHVSYMHVPCYSLYLDWQGDFHWSIGWPIPHREDSHTQINIPGHCVMPCLHIR